MCHRCPGLPGFGLLHWPQEEEEVLEMGKITVLSKVAEIGRCRRCDCPGHQHQNLEQWLIDVKKRCKEMRLIVSCWAQSQETMIVIVIVLLLLLLLLMAADDDAAAAADDDDDDDDDDGIWILDDLLFVSLRVCV